MKADVFDLNGAQKKQVTLPRAFETPYHPELIKRAVLSMQAEAKQPKGRMAESGMQNTARYRGARALPTAERSINVGHARLPRLKNRGGLLHGRVARVPQSVGGRKTHAPKVEENIREKINRKEKRAALLSAIASTANRELVAARHVLEKNVTLPLVVDDALSGIAKTREIIGALKALNVYSDVENAKEKRSKRSGNGKKRGRKYRHKTSILIVTKDTAPVYRAARNLSGVQVCSLRNLNTELLAPGSVAGRLTVWTESAALHAGNREKEAVKA